MTRDELELVVRVVYEVRRLLEIDYAAMKAGGAGTWLEDTCAAAIGRYGAADKIDAFELAAAVIRAVGHDIQNRKG